MALPSSSASPLPDTPKDTRASIVWALWERGSSSLRGLIALPARRRSHLRSRGKAERRERGVSGALIFGGEGGWLPAWVFDPPQVEEELPGDGVSHEHRLAASEVLLHEALYRRRVLVQGRPTRVHCSPICEVNVGAQPPPAAG